jgi:hypothetical protein
MNDVEPAVSETPAQVPHEISVGFERHQNRILAHPAQDFAGERANAGTVLQEYSSAVPIDFGENVIDQEAGARDQTAEHARVLDEVAPEEQQLSGTRGALCGHVERRSAFQQLFVLLRGTWPAPAEPAPPGVHQMSGDG